MRRQYARSFCFALLTASAVTLPSSYRHASASNHREVPIVTLADTNLDTSDIYFVPGVSGADRIAVVAAGTPSLDPTGDRTIFYADYFVDLPTTTPTVVYTDQVTGLNAVQPQIVATDSGKVAITWLNETDFFGAPPFMLPTASISIFDPPAASTAAVQPLGTPGAGQRVPALATDGESFTVFLPEGVAGNGLLGGTIVGRRYDEDGTFDGDFTPPAIMRLAAPFEEQIGLAVTDNGDTIVSRVDNIGSGFPAPNDIVSTRYDAMGNPIGDDVIINTRPAFDTRKITVSGDLTRIHSFGVELAAAQVYDGDLTISLSGLDTIANAPSNTYSAAIGTYPNFLPFNPDLAININDVLMVVYQAETFNGPIDRGDIFAERLLVNGARMDGFLQVNSMTTGIQEKPSVAALSNGGFFVSFTGPTAGSFNTSILGIDLPAPMPTGPNTLIASDYVTPWTPIDLAGYTVTFNDGPTDANNNATIDTNPADPDSANGALRLMTNDPSGGDFEVRHDATGLHTLFPPGLEAPPNQPFGGIFVSADANALSLSPEGVGVEPTGTFTLNVFDSEDADAPGFTQAWTFSVEPAPADLLRGAEAGNAAPELLSLVIDASLSPELRAALGSDEFPYFDYTLSFSTNGPGELFLDNLRVDLVPVPEPATLAALFAAATLAAGISRRRGRRPHELNSNTSTSEIAGTVADEPSRRGQSTYGGLLSLQYAVGFIALGV